MPAVQIVRRSSVSDPEFESDNLVDLWSKDALAMFWTIIQLFDGATVKNRGRKAEKLIRLKGSVILAGLWRGKYMAL